MDFVKLVSIAINHYNKNCFYSEIKKHILDNHISVLHENAFEYALNHTLKNKLFYKNNLKKYYFNFKKSKTKLKLKNIFTYSDFLKFVKKKLRTKINDDNIVIYLFKKCIKYNKLEFFNKWKFINFHTYINLEDLTKFICKYAYIYKNTDFLDNIFKLINNNMFYYKLFNYFKNKKSQYYKVIENNIFKFTDKADYNKILFDSDMYSIVLLKILYKKSVNYIYPIGHLKNLTLNLFKNYYDKILDNNNISMYVYVYSFLLNKNDLFNVMQIHNIIIDEDNNMKAFMAIIFYNTYYKINVKKLKEYAKYLKDIKNTSLGLKCICVLLNYSKQFKKNKKYINVIKLILNNEIFYNFKKSDYKYCKIILHKNKKNIFENEVYNMLIKSNVHNTIEFANN